MSNDQDQGPDQGADLPPLDQALEQAEPAIEDHDLEPVPPAQVPAGESPRVAVRYSAPDEDTSTVSLPGYISPNPAIVRDGDVFTVDARFVEELTGSDRFVLEPDYDAAAVQRAPYEALNKAELGTLLGLPEARVEETLKADLVELAVDAEKSNPQPPGSAGDLIEETSA